MSNALVQYNVATTPVALTCSLANLASGSMRQSTVVDNSSNRFVDYQVFGKLQAASATTGIVNVWVFAGIDSDTNDFTDGAGATDAAFTAANRLNSRLLWPVRLNGTTQVNFGPVSVAARFGGICPVRWGLIVDNQSGVALGATAGNLVLQQQGVYFQSA